MIENRDRIVVEWRDTLDNYTKDREKDIIKYFRQKYDTNNIRVKFSAIKNNSSADMDDYRVEADENIYSQDHQMKLSEKWLKDNGISNIKIGTIKKLDSKVESELDYDNSEITNRVFKIKWVEFRNFLSFDDTVQKINYEDYSGLTTVRSNPSNYGGKTTAIVDLLLFLFFGKTTKTKTLDEVFNLYTNSNELYVKGSVEIDGEEYIINRRLVRRKKGDVFIAKSKLDYYIPLPDGGYQNLNGEARQKTDKIISSYVGNMEDFLLTIITTGDNLPDLVNATPTESGKIFTRFIGLDYFREKETIAKKLKKEWLLQANSNRYNEEELVEAKKEQQTIIDDTNNIIGSVDSTIDNLNELISELKIDIENNKNKRHTNLDNDLLLKSEDEITSGINKLKEAISYKFSERERLLSEAKSKKPEAEYDIETYGHYKEVRDNDYRLLADLKAKLPVKEARITELENIDTCQYCGKELTVRDTDSINTLKEEVEQIKIDIENGEANLVDSQNQIKEYEKLNEQHNEYNKVLISIERLDVELEKYNNSLEKGEELLAKYLDNKEKIELNKELNSKITLGEVELSQKQNELRTKELNRVSLVRDIETATKRISEFEEIEKEIENERKVLNIFNTYINLYGKKGISKMVLGSLIPLINMYLDQLLDGVAPFRLELRLNDKNEVEFITHNLEKDVSKNLMSGSGYEKTVSALAIRTILTKVCALPKPNIIAFDEVFGKVSEDNLELLEDFFKRLLDYFDNIFVISHNHVVQSWGDNEIIIEKVDDKSKLIN